MFYKIKKFLLKEWLFFITLTVFLATLTLNKASFKISKNEIEVICILFMLFISIKGLEESNLISFIAQKIEQGSYIAIKLIFGTFFLSMFLTNDVALIAIVPLTLKLNIKNKSLIVILEAIAANSGSVLTPFGNPQNLFIYWHYHLNILTFFHIIALFAAYNAILLFIISIFINTQKKIEYKRKITVNIEYASLFTFSLLLVILTILHILPIYFSSILIAFAPIINPKALKIDYLLLLTFLLFFAITNNLSPILKEFFKDIKDIFMASVLSSQIISNVPTALLFAKFTSNFKALLWGVSVGGFGTLIGSLANLIAYKLFSKEQKEKGFFIKFNAINFAFLALNILFYYFLKEAF